MNTLNERNNGNGHIPIRYRQLADQTDNKGVKAIMTMLADEEVKHYNTIEEMKAEKLQLAQTTILTDAKNVFVQIKESNEKFDFDRSNFGTSKFKLWYPLTKFEEYVLDNIDKAKKGDAVALLGLAL